MAALQQQVNQAEQAALQAGADPQRLAVAKQLMRDNPRGFIGLCQRFVENVAGTSGQYPSAIAASNAIEGSTDWANMQPGDTIYFTPNAGNEGYGHAGIYAGNGMFINPGPSGVQTSSLTDWMNQTGQRLIEYIPQGGNRRAPGLASYATEDDYTGNDFGGAFGEDFETSPAPPGWSYGGDTTSSPGGAPDQQYHGPIPFPTTDGYSYMPTASPGTWLAHNDRTGDLYSFPVTYSRNAMGDLEARPGQQKLLGKSSPDSMWEVSRTGRTPYGSTPSGLELYQDPETGEFKYRTSPKADAGMTDAQRASNALGWAQYYRQEAQDSWQQATDARDFEAAEKWKNIANQWKEREVALQEEQYLTGLEKNPADWAAYSYASRGRQGDFPRGSAPPEGIQTLAGAGRNVPEWLRGMYSNLTPNAAGSPTSNAPEDLGSQFLTHLAGIGSSLESPDVQTQFNDWSVKRQENAPQPASVKDTPWFNAAFKGGTLPGYRPPALGLPNLGALASMTPTEREQMGGAYAAEGVPFQDILDTLKRRIPTGQAVRGRWGA